MNCKKLCDVLRKQVLAQLKELPIKHLSKSSDGEDSKEDDVQTEMMEVAEELTVITKAKRKRRANKVRFKNLA